MFSHRHIHIIHYYILIMQETANNRIEEPTNNDGAEAETPPAVDTTDTSPINILTDAVDEFQCAECGCLIDVSELTAFTQVECPDCGSVEGVPARLGNFLLLKLLGTGGMGGVYYAKDESLGRFVAIKVILQSLGDDAEFIETFRREAQAVAKLNHPNIAQIYSFGQEKGQPYIVMELVDGKRVDKMMEQEGGISTSLAMRICYEVAQGLNAADEAGIVHGDIKPENILLDTKGRAKVVDFGLATVAHSAASEGIWGTPYYIAPEKVRRQKVDARADIYSLGATLYHILAGKPPFEGATPVEVVKARLEAPPPDLKEVRPDIPDKVVSVITRMLATERTERYPTYKSLLSDLRKALQSLSGNISTTAHLGGKTNIRIRKKNSTLNVPSAASSNLESAAPAPTNRKKRIIISKNTGQRGTMSMKTKPTQAEKDIAAPPEPTPEELAQKQRARAKKLHRVLTIISIVIILALTAGITCFVVDHKQKTIQHRAEYFALIGARKTSVTLYAEITCTASNVAAMVAKTSDYEPVLRKAVLTITGQELFVPEPEPEPEPEPKAETESKADSDKVGEGESEDASKEDAVDTGTANVEVTPAVEANAENEEDANNAEPTVADAPNTDEQAPTEPAIEEEATEPVVVTIPDADLPPIAISARNTILNLRKLNTVNQRSQALLEPATIAYTTAQKVLTSRTAIANVSELKKMAEKVNLYNENAKMLYDTAKLSYTKIVAENKAYEEKVASEKRAALEEQKRMEETAEEERKQLALEERGKAETKQAKLDHADMKLLFAEHNFDAVVTALEEKREGYQTEVGKAALQVSIDRFKHVSAMREELIANINATPFAWGWGSGSASRDIVKASKEGIFIKDNPTAFLWQAVSITQMLKLVDYYIEARTTRATSKSTIAFGAAIYCDEFGEKGKAKSKGYLNRALNFGFSRKDQERLLPSGW